MTVASDPNYQSTLDAVYAVYVLPAGASILASRSATSSRAARRRSCRPRTQVTSPSTNIQVISPSTNRQVTRPSTNRQVANPFTNRQVTRPSTKDVFRAHPQAVRLRAHPQTTALNFGLEERDVLSRRAPPLLPPENRAQVTSPSTNNTMCYDGIVTWARHQAGGRDLLGEGSRLEARHFFDQPRFLLAVPRRLLSTPTPHFMCG